MKRLIRNRLGTWLTVVAAVFCIGLSGCGGDGGGSPDSGTSPSAAAPSSAPAPGDSGGDSATGDEYCDALMAAMEEYDAELSSQDDFSEMFAKYAEALRKVEPHASGDTAAALETLIDYYEAVASGGMEAVGSVGDDFSRAIQGVFGPCAVMPPIPAGS
ncbi:MAG TPA: hypothetical protein VKY81_08060 [Natronosporangium sp.]|nr:hypothetical protein [Natronosporangium sp.]